MAEINDKKIHASMDLLDKQKAKDPSIKDLKEIITIELTGGEVVEYRFAMAIIPDADEPKIIKNAFLIGLGHHLAMQRDIALKFIIEHHANIRGAKQ